MRKSILLLFTVFGISVMPVSTVSAQGLTVTVRSDKKFPVAYAHVTVNRKAFAATDSVGVVHIPLSRLSVGDTISVSYIGTSAEDLVFDRQVAARGSHTFTLRERPFVIDAVTVTAGDDRKLFNKYVELLAPTPARYLGMVVGGEFEYSDSSRSVAGAFTARNGRKDREFPDVTFVNSLFFKHPVQFSAASDTTGLSKYLSRDAHYLLSQSYLWLGFVANDRARATLGTRYTYLGEDAGNRVFRLMFTSTDGYPAHMLIHADAVTKRLKKMEIRTLSAPDDRVEDILTAIYRNDVESVDIVAECETIKVRGMAATSFIAFIAGSLGWLDGDEARSTETELRNMEIVN